MGENPSIYTHNKSRESYSIPRKCLSISVCHGCVAHDRHAPMNHIRHGIGNRHILTERNDLNPNTADILFGRTPLSWAARNGHEGVVRSMLERSDVYPDTADTLLGQTPLSLAAGYGHAGVMRMLLERNDVNPNTVDTKHGQTPLSWAAEKGF